MLGKLVSHYRILELIGEGGMGAVWKAQDLNLSRQVAIKALKPSRLDGSGASARFLREALAISRIDHPNVITLFEVLEQDDTFYIVMQYVGGQSLRERLRQGKVAIDEVLRIACEVGAGLGAAHVIDVIHRDLKPENVMQTSGGACKVLDFGVAHLMDRSTLTIRGGLVGTIRYMAPEQVRGEPPDPRTDVHALGALVFELLTGTPSVAGDSEAAVLFEILNTKPPSVARLRPEVSKDLAIVVARALEKDPRDRYPNMAAMLADLETVQRGLRAASGASTRTLHIHRPIARRPLSVALILFMIAAASYFVVMRMSIAEPTVLVMKWENATGDPSNDWLCGGIMDGLIRALSAREGLNVVSRQTVVSALGVGPRALAGFAPSEPSEIARQLGARFMATGSVESQGGGLRVSCELLDVRHGTLLRSWSRELPDLRTQLLPMVDAFASSIAARIGARLPRRSREVRPSSQTLTVSLEALRLYDEALERNEMNDIHSAADRLRQATALDSTFTDAHLLLALLTPELRERRRHLSLAMEHRFAASNRTRTLIEAEQLLEDDQLDAAKARYESLLANDPADVAARVSLATVLRAERRFSEAVSEFAVIHRVNPFDFSFYPLWASDYVDAGRKDKALALVAGWRRQFPNEVGPLESLIGLHSLLGNYELALILCDTLGMLRPLAELRARGRLLADLGRLRAADSTFRELERHPNLYRSRTRGTSYRAFLAYRRGRFEEGSQLIQAPLREQPDGYNHWLAGILAAGAHDTATASRHASAIASEIAAPPKNRLDPDANIRRRFYFHLRGMIALVSREPGRAADMFREALRYAGPSDDLFFRRHLALAMVQAGESDQAVRELERALEFNPRQPETLLELGDALIRTRKYDRALEVLMSLKRIWVAADPDGPLRRRLDSLLKVASSRRG